ncbi:MAG TPA: ATPase, T2SS/T4P/T4SS family, partial [Silvibacterium sp.]|nr:ATPase, T2SS/T4P/T4SS family [Silvibacterium sp.]
MGDAGINIAQARPETAALRQNGVSSGSSLRTGSRGARPLEEKQQQELKSAVHQELIRRLDLEKLGDAQESRVGQQQLLALIQQIITEQNVPLSAGERDRVANEVMDELFGLGPLEPLLKDETISDILVNTYSHVYVERKGVLQRTSVTFKDNRHLLQIIDKIVSAVGRRVDESTPMVDARLKDGSRVNAIIPPLAIDGPILSIRRFGSSPLTADNLLHYKALSQPMLDTLKAAVQARMNIVIAGGTGAGKTTLLNMLSSFISEKERIVTIEDSAELQLRQEHVVRLETRPRNVEG